MNKFRVTFEIDFPDGFTCEEVRDDLQVIRFEHGSPFADWISVQQVKDVNDGSEKGGK